MSGGETAPEIHPVMKPLGWLLGKWVANEGRVFYPTMEEITYKDELEIIHDGRPFFDYSSRTSHAETNAPMHWDKGFIRVKPGTNEVGLFAAHNLGAAEVCEGTVEGNELFLRSVIVTLLSFSIGNASVKHTRHYKLQDGELHILIRAETDDHPMQDHLVAVYKKV